MHEIPEDHAAPERRHLSWVQNVTGIGAVIAIVSTVGGAFSYAFDLLPFAKAADVAAVERRVTAVERGLNSLQIGQKETQELQLMDRVQALADRLARTPADSADFSEFRQQRVAAQQRLLQIREELTSARGQR